MHCSLLFVDEQIQQLSIMISRIRIFFGFFRFQAAVFWFSAPIEFASCCIHCRFSCTNNNLEVLHHSPEFLSMSFVLFILGVVFLPFSVCSALFFTLSIYLCNFLWPRQCFVRLQHPTSYILGYEDKHATWLVILHHPTLPFSGNRVNSFPQPHLLAPPPPTE